METKTKNVRLSREQSSILRDLKFEDKLEKIKQWFPEPAANELIDKLTRREEKKNLEITKEIAKRAKAEAERHETERIQRMEHKRSRLYKVISFLNECLAKKRQPEAVEVLKIRKWMTYDDYLDFRDQYIQVICVAFYFEADQNLLDAAAQAKTPQEAAELEYRANPVKAEATAFVDYIMGSLQIAEMGIIERMLSGGYISSKSYFLLKKHSQLIHEAGFSQWIIDRIGKMLAKGYVEGFVCRDGVCKLDKSFFNAKKIAMMNELVEIYKGLQNQAKPAPCLTFEAQSFEAAAAAQGIES